MQAIGNTCLSVFIVPVHSDSEGNKIGFNGQKSSTMFCLAERLTPKIPAFAWLFIRPPWSIHGSCCKELVYNNMIKHVEKVREQPAS